MLLKRTHKRLLKVMEDTPGLESMTVNERLHHFDLKYDFDTAMLNDKTRARQILAWLKVDEGSIELIVTGAETF